jgi:hypothetical protein
MADQSSRQRRAAAALMIAGGPAVIAVTLAGGAYALLPLALLLLPILALGRPPGIEALERAGARGRPPGRADDAPRLRRPVSFAPRACNPIAGALAERAPPFASAAG